MPRRKGRQTGSAPLTSTTSAKCLHGGEGVATDPCRSGLGGHRASSSLWAAGEMPSWSEVGTSCGLWHQPKMPLRDDPYKIQLPSQWLGGCFFFLFSGTSERRILKHSYGGWATMYWEKWVKFNTIWHEYIGNSLKEYEPPGVADRYPDPVQLCRSTAGILPGENIFPNPRAVKCNIIIDKYR